MIVIKSKKAYQIAAIDTRSKYASRERVQCFLSLKNDMAEKLQQPMHLLLTCQPTINLTINLTTNNQLHH